MQIRPYFFEYGQYISEGQHLFLKTHDVNEADWPAHKSYNQITVADPGFPRPGAANS